MDGMMQLSGMVASLTCPAGLQPYAADLKKTIKNIGMMKLNGTVPSLTLPAGLQPYAADPQKASKKHTDGII